MRKKILTVSLLALLINLTPLLAEFGDVASLENRVKETTLDNGMKIVVVERHAAPLFFSLISFRVGSNQELPNHSGLSHFLEHMLFKGTETVGTLDRQKEIVVMEELEQTAVRIRDLQIAMQAWRYDMFNEYATKVKMELPEETREKIGADAASGWLAVLDALPADINQLPEEWRKNEWTLKDREHNYWEMYRELISEKAGLLTQIKNAKQLRNESETLDGIYKQNGAKMINAFTTTDETTYMVGLPSNCLELFLVMEADRFKNPVFREFYNERDVVQEEFRMRGSNPFAKMYKKMTQTAFQAHPYQKPVIGYLSDIDLTLRSDMEQHFENYYAPNNCQLTIVGDVKAKEVFKLAKKHFGDWKPGKEADVVTVVEPEQGGEKRAFVEHDAEPRVMMGYHVPVAPHPDYYSLAMIDQLLTNGRTSRFYKSIFVDQGLTAGSPGAFTGPGEKYPNIFMINGVPKAPHTTLEVEEAIYAELDKLKNEPVSERELERVRNKLQKYELNRMASNQWLAFTIASAFVNRGDWRSVSEDLERTLNVTAADIQRVAKKYFNADNRTVVTLVKPEIAGSSKMTGMEGSN